MLRRLGLDPSRACGFAAVALACGCNGCGAETPAPDASSSSTGGTPIVADCDNDWCRIPAGTFVIGSPESEWGHPLQAENQAEVTLTRDFVIQRYELTQDRWSSSGFPNPSGVLGDGTGDCVEEKCPVGNVTWFEAIAFANYLSQSEGLGPCYELIGCIGAVGSGMSCDSVNVLAPSLYQCEGYRLSTEAEWEYAARAMTTTPFYSGDITVYGAQTDCNPDVNLDKVAWYCFNAGPTTHPVGSKEPNAFGLHDMHGNAHEWVHNHYTPEGYGSGPLTDPGGEMAPNDTRVTRGGRFNLWSVACRSAARLYAPFNSRAPSIGFRLVRTAL